MRLDARQISAILALTRNVMGEDASVTVFGSRVDDSRRGGDLDLLVEAAQRPSLLQRAELKYRLEGVLAMPVDIITRQRGSVPTTFQTLALGRGRRLEQIQ